jgi:hypothetical protein
MSECVTLKPHVAVPAFSPRMVTRRIRRRSSAQKSVSACNVQRLSHIRTLPALLIEEPRLLLVIEQLL